MSIGDLSPADAAVLEGANTANLQMCLEGLAAGGNPEVRCWLKRTALQRLLAVDVKESMEDAVIGIAQALITAGADPNMWSTQPWEYGERALHKVARTWRTGLARALLESGADPMALDACRRTALDHAMPVDWKTGGPCRTGHLHVPMARLLMEYGADPHHRCDIVNAPTPAEIWMQWSPERATEALAYWDERQLRALALPSQGLLPRVRL